MRYLAYLLFLIFLYPLAFLPLWLQYKVAKVLKFVLAVIMRYRRKIIYQNLRRAFPVKSEEEIKQISNDYYEHLCNLFAESFNSFSIKKKDLLQRVTLKNLDLIERLYSEKKNITVLMGHTGNWEWAGLAASSLVPYTCYAVYHALEQPYFDSFLIKSRTRFGLHLLSSKKVRNFFRLNAQELFLNAFIADQTPSNPKSAYWVNFLGTPTPFFTGAEKFARQLETAVIYVDTQSVSKGKYEIELILISENGSEEPEGYITAKYVSLLEQSIIKNPASWLWSHRRWKHKLPQGKELIRQVYS